VIVSCDTGMRAGASADKLRALGIKEVFTLQGGLNAWRDAGLPVSK
jgi:rhodanese-related sulfurtransferase